MATLLLSLPPFVWPSLLSLIRTLIIGFRAHANPEGSCVEILYLVTSAKTFQMRFCLQVAEHGPVSGGEAGATTHPPQQLRPTDSSRGGKPLGAALGMGAQAAGPLSTLLLGKPSSPAHLALCPPPSRHRCCNYNRTSRCHSWDALPTLHPPCPPPKPATLWGWESAEVENHQDHQTPGHPVAARPSPRTPQDGARPRSPAADLKVSPDLLLRFRRSSSWFRGGISLQRERHSELLPVRAWGTCTPAPTSIHITHGGLQWQCWGPGCGLSQAEQGESSLATMALGGHMHPLDCASGGGRAPGSGQRPACPAQGQECPQAFHGEHGGGPEGTG